MGEASNRKVLLRKSVELSNSKRMTGWFCTVGAVRIPYRTDGVGPGRCAPLIFHFQFVKSSCRTLLKPMEYKEL